MHWEKAEGSIGEEKVMIWEAKPGSNGQNEMRAFVI